jgi:hypothetical protein
LVAQQNADRPTLWSAFVCFQPLVSLTAVTQVRW